MTVPPSDEPLYKVLTETGAPAAGTSEAWPLPAAGRRWGRWMPKLRGPLALHRNGYHVFRLPDLFYNLGPRIHPAEVRGEVLLERRAVVAREARIGAALETWTPATARRLAVDCAGRVLPLFERFRSDDRPRRAIDAARKHAAGDITDEQLAVARDDAWAAAHRIDETIAWYAAQAAFDCADPDSPWTSALVAARSALEAVGCEADADELDWDIAQRRERRWQIERLAAYLAGAVSDAS